MLQVADQAKDSVKPVALVIDALLLDEERAVRDSVRAYVRKELTPRLPYEGTDELHTLAVGAAITGQAAFR